LPEGSPSSLECPVAATVQKGQIRQLHDDVAGVTFDAGTGDERATGEVQFAGDPDDAHVVAGLDKNRDRVC
jgi:hypothetical protein